MMNNSIFIHILLWAICHTNLKLSNSERMDSKTSTIEGTKEIESDKEEMVIEAMHSGGVLSEDSSSILEETTYNANEKLSEKAYVHKTENITKLTAVASYRKLLRHKRVDHKDAVTNILELSNYEKQYKMVELILGRISQVMTSSKIVLAESGYVPGDTFPEKENTLDALSATIENTLFAGDILLRMPDITHTILAKNKDFNLIIHWGLSLSSESQLLEELDMKVINLMTQELGIVEKDPNYVNPYREVSILEDHDFESTDFERRTEKKKKQKKKKGPQLSRNVHTDL